MRVQGAGRCSPHSLVEDEVEADALGAALTQHAHQQRLAVLGHAHLERGLGAGLGLGAQAGLCGGWGGKGAENGAARSSAQWQTTYLSFVRKDKTT